MYTLSNVLGIARNAITAHQLGVQVASQNISNANTEGYSRQRLTLTSGTSISTPIGASSSGVAVKDISRVRDTFLDAAYRRDSAKAESFGMRRDLMQQVEGVFGEPSETGIGATLDAFWASWSDLANDPTSTSARNMIRQRGVQVTSILHHSASELNTLRADARSRLDTMVGQINGYSAEVARLNEEIVTYEVTGHTANDLRDARDLAVDNLARLGAVRTDERADGSISLVFENTTLVDGGNAKELAVGASGSNLNVQTASGTVVSPASEGSTIGELLKVINVDIPNVRAKLDDLAEGLVNGVNGVYALGNGGTAGDFFDSTLTTADSVVLSSAVLTDSSVIPSGFSTAAGDNELALAMSNLQTDAGLTIGTTTTSFGNFYRDMIAGIAVEVSTADSSTSVYGAMATQSETRRQSVSGVSVDEELIRLMQHQQAYAAATRVISTVDEMLQTLFNM